MFKIESYVSKFINALLLASYFKQAFIQNALHKVLKYNFDQ